MVGMTSFVSLTKTIHVISNLDQNERDVLFVDFDHLGHRLTGFRLPLQDYHTISLSSIHYSVIYVLIDEVTLIKVGKWRLSGEEYRHLV